MLWFHRYSTFNDRHKKSGSREINFTTTYSVLSDNDYDFYFHLCNLSNASLKSAVVVSEGQQCSNL